MIISDKELDELEEVADAMIAETLISFRLMSVFSIGYVYKKLIAEIRRLRKQDKKRSVGHLSIVRDE